MSKFRKLLQSQSETGPVSSEPTASPEAPPSPTGGVPPRVQISPRPSTQKPRAVPKKVSAQAYKIPESHPDVASPPPQNSISPALAARDDLDYVKITAYVRKPTQLQVQQRLLEQGEMDLSELIDRLLKQWLSEQLS